MTDGLGLMAFAPYNPQTVWGTSKSHEFPEEFDFGYFAYSSWWQSAERGPSHQIQWRI